MNGTGRICHLLVPVYLCHLVGVHIFNVMHKFWSKIVNAEIFKSWIFSTQIFHDFGILDCCNPLMSTQMELKILYHIQWSGVSQSHINANDFLVVDHKCWNRYLMPDVVQIYLFDFIFCFVSRHCYFY